MPMLPPSANNVMHSKPTGGKSPPNATAIRLLPLLSSRSDFGWLACCPWCWWATCLRHEAQAEQDDAIVAEFLVTDIVAEHPLLLGPPPTEPLQLPKPKDAQLETAAT